jgi:transcriptional regulator with XRE-family HTH domain
VTRETRDEAWEKLGNRLRKVREYLNYSQQYVAEHTGIPRSAISDIERGARKVDSLELHKLARLYRYPTGYFLDEADDPAAADHTLQALTRAMTDLTEQDREEILRFAQFLRYQGQAERKRSPR